MSLERAIGSLADIIRVQSDNITRLGEKMEAANDKTNASIDRMSGEISKMSTEITKLTVQVGSFATSIVEMKALMRQITQETQQQNETAKLQAQNVAQLIAHANRLLERN